MNLLAPDTGLLFWMVVIFAIIFFVLAKFGFPVITKMVEKRADHIESSLQAAKEADLRLSQIQQEQDELLKEARAEQGRILKEASEARDKIVAQAKADAQAQAAKILEQASQEILAQKESALVEIRMQVAALSLEVAQKLVRKNLSDDKEQLALVEKMLDEVVSDKVVRS